MRRGEFLDDGHEDVLDDHLTDAYALLQALRDKGFEVVQNQATAESITPP